MEIKSRFFEEDDSNPLQMHAQNYLMNYMRWKWRKWKAITKIENTKMHQSLLTLLENEELICKICAKNVIAKNMKEHSILCKQRAETMMKIKESLELLRNDFLPWIFEDRRKISLEIIILK